MADFESIDKNELTMLQMIAYNYVLESKSNTKTAGKIMSIIKKDEGLLKDWQAGYEAKNDSADY